MTDLEKFIKLYSDLGFDVKTEKDLEKERLTITLHQGTHADKENHTLGFDGYMGFYSVISFDLNGKFIKQGFWE